MYSQDEEEAQSTAEDGAHWISVSDLMAALMMVFLLLSVIFMVIVQKESQKIKEVAELYIDLRENFYQDLLKEFEKDLPRWGAELKKDLSLQFYNTDILFEIGSADLKPSFELILDDFFPRYTKIITSDAYRNEIAEVRIEGHTSSDWTNAVNEDEAYINNMRLSQARTRSTLAYLLSLQAVLNQKSWLLDHVTANGLSSSKLILDIQGQEDSERSRRVEFRLRTDADARIRAILERGT